MKKDFFTELIVPHAYVREVDIKSERKQTIFKKREPLSRRDILDRIINTSYNKKWPDGRIYGLDKDGNYVSHSVTPYAKSFLDNIEDGIKPLVIALRDKGYLSFSSCEGHCLWDRRFVMLVFPSKEAALEFQERIPFNLTFKIIHCTDMLNVELSVDEYGRINNAEKKQLHNELEQSLKYVNTFIKRNYADAWFLEMIIADPIPYTNGVLKYFKNIKQILFKKFFLTSYTKRITDFITNKLPPNIY